MDTKAQIREAMKNILTTLSTQEIAQRSVVVCERLQEMCIENGYQTIGVYRPLAGEPDITPFVERCVAQYKTVLIPQATEIYTTLSSISSREEMDAQRLRSADRSRPVQLPSVPVDLLVVPWLAFTEQWQRLGRGSGWYDKMIGWLRQWSSVYVVGVWWREQKVSFLPIDSHDQCMDEMLIV